MKTRTRPSLRSALVLATAFILPAFASAQVLQSWQFNDTNGTTLPNVVNSAGSAFFATGITGVATNSAALRFTSSASGAAARAFADIPDISTGTYQLEVNVAGWDFTGAPAVGPRVEIGFSATNANANSSRLAHILFDVTDTETVLAGVASGGGTDTPFANDQFFGLVQTTPVTFRLLVNFDTSAYTVTNSEAGFTNGGSGTIANALTRPASFIQIRALDNFAIGGTGFFAVDSITLTAIPEPATAAALFGVAALALAGARRRRR